MQHKNGHNQGKLMIFSGNILFLGYGFMVFIATFYNISVISWWSVLLVEETGVAGENLASKA